jgi:hypothetical protein
MDRSGHVHRSGVLGGLEQRVAVGCAAQFGVQALRSPRRDVKAVASALRVLADADLDQISAGDLLLEPRADA